MRKFTLLLSLVPILSSAQQDLNLLLAKAVSYHDPQGSWSDLQATLYFTETRPTGTDRKTTFEIDNKVGHWRLNRNDEEIYEVSGEKAVVIKGDKGVERALLLRNYYLYLWGLPMKLYDKSTPEITQSEDEKVGDREAYVLRVPYEAETYYFYFDKETGRMLQYKFYKDEPADKGELIKLEDEILIGYIKIPQKRSWYTLPEMKYLGTDILDRIE